MFQLYPPIGMAMPLNMSERAKPNDVLATKRPEAIPPKARIAQIPISHPSNRMCFSFNKKAREN